ncbi:MAG: hypothetical protein WC560_05205 [Syntrophales bacterium]
MEVIYFISLMIMIIISFSDKEIRQSRGFWGGHVGSGGTPPAIAAFLVIATIPILNTIFVIWYFYDKWMEKK